MVKKEQVRSKIFNAVIAAEVTKGHLKWKLSDIARSTGVSRPLVYYHFGKTKEQILSACLDVLAEQYYGLNFEREAMLRNGQILDSLIQTRQMLTKNPQLAIFYQKWRSGSDSPLKSQLIEIEKRYQQKLKTVFPLFSNDKIAAVHAIFHGLITAPFLDLKSLEKAFDLVRPLFE